MIRAMLAMLQIGVAGRNVLADVPFGQWLDEQNRIRQREQDRKFNELIQAVQELRREVRDQRRPIPPVGPGELKK